ncbi:unnamed protein product, partial [Prorocentrum cordatum]
TKIWHAPCRWTVSPGAVGDLKRGRREEGEDEEEEEAEAEEEAEEEEDGSPKPFGEALRLPRGGRELLLRPPRAEAPATCRAWRADRSPPRPTGVPEAGTEPGQRALGHGGPEPAPRLEQGPTALACL